MLASIHWNADPEIFTLGPLTVRWYGLLFALGFLLGQQLLIRMFRGEGKPESDVEVLTFYMVLSTIIGARLGHMLFYDFKDLLADPLSVFRVWEGGLASHGAGVGIFIALYLYAHYGIAFFHEGKLLHVWKRRKPGQSYLWVTDRIAVTVALAGCCIRLGNLMNSEIIGKQTDVPWAFIFEKVDLVPRHPAQLYEAVTCIILLFILYAYWKRRKEHTPEGSITGLFMIYIFTLRFFYEFLKEPQVDFENGLIQQIGLNMGQILSIPAVAFGIFLWVYSHRQARPANVKA
jgi:prolipoprotein diacylglyceryl transferase